MKARRTLILFAGTVLSAAAVVFAADSDESPAKHLAPFFHPPKEYADDLCIKP